MRKLYILILVCFSLYGCASVQMTRLTDKSLPKLNSSGSVYILVPENGAYYGKVYPDSGKTIASVINYAFLKHLKKTEIASEGVKVNVGINNAKDKGFTYLIDSKILHWADHATEWSGIRDRIDINLDIYDVASAQLLDSVKFKGNGTWWTFGGYHPENIVIGSMDEYVSSLFSNSKEEFRK